MFWRSRAVRAAIVAAALSAGSFEVGAVTIGASASPVPAGTATAGAAASANASFETWACGAPSAGSATCNAVQLLTPLQHWAPGPWGHRQNPQAAPSGPAATPAPPSSGYFPADLLSAYGLTSAATSMAPGPAAPTVAIVDAYDDPNAASDLSAYRSSMSGSQDPNTALTDPSIPPLCSSTVTTGCATFTKVNQTGGTTYPSGNTGWAEEISLDLDTVSAVCPDCNIVLVEASNSSLSNLAQAVTEAKTFHPAAITNSYGGSESSSETSSNSTYSAGASTAITAATGDSAYGVEFPAASPNLTAVGGTSLHYTGSGAGIQWQAQTVWADSGSGCSADEAMPSWQAVQGVYSSSATCSTRQVADLSADADPQTGFAAYDTYGQGGWLVFGGTSLSTQIVGASYALASASGTLHTNPSALYQDAGTTNTGPTPGIVPVTSGSNGNCGNYLCNATDHLPSGYNGPAGLGTLYGLSALNGTVASTNPSLSFSPSSESGNTGSAIGPVSVDLSQAAPASFNISLATTSGTGGFATTSAGPFVPTLSLTVSTGSTAASSAFYYEDPTAGSPTVTASAAGYTSANMTVKLSSPSSTPSMTVTVAAGSVRNLFGSYRASLTVTARNSTSGAALSGASVTLQVYQGSSCTGTVAASGTGTTTSAGTATFNFSTRTATTWCALAGVTGTGYNPGSGQTTFNT